MGLSDLWLKSILQNIVDILPDTLIHHSSSDVRMSGCLLDCFPVGESESAPPFRNLFALHLISLFWQVRVGTLVVRNRWTHHQTTRGKTLKTLFSSGYLLVCLTTIRVLHLQIPHDSFERPDMSSSRCHALLSLKRVHLQARKLTFWTPKLVVFCRCFSFSKWVVFKFYGFFFGGCNLLRQGFL